MSSDKKDILKALEEMEQTSQEINARKERVEARIQKHSKPKIEPTREELIKKKKDEADLNKTASAKAYLTKTIILFSVALCVAWIRARGSKVEFIFNIIAGIVFLGFYLMFLNSRK